MMKDNLNGSRFSVLNPNVNTDSKLLFVSGQTEGFLFFYIIIYYLYNPFHKFITHFQFHAPLNPKNACMSEMIASRVKSHK